MLSPEKADLIMNNMSADSLSMPTTGTTSTLFFIFMINIFIYIGIRMFMKMRETLGVYPIISRNSSTACDSSTLSVMYIKKSKWRKRRELEWKQIKVDQLSPTAAKQVRDKLNLYYKDIKQLVGQSEGCRQELLCYGAFFEALNDELEDAISKTDSNYEEKLLLKNLEHPCNLLEEIISKLKKIKAEEDLAVQFKLEAENEIEKEFSDGEHLYDFGTTRELANMLHEEAGPDYTPYEKDSSKNDASADNCKKKKKGKKKKVKRLSEKFLARSM